MKSTLFICALFLQFSTVAQTPHFYQFQQDDSLVKNTYLDQARLKLQEALNGIGKDYKEDYKEIYKGRFDEVKALLKSSRTVTADVPHRYLQKILEKIRVVNPELSALPIRLVFSRDWWPNAYSMGEGTLVVNAGLMVFLANESELAFVLCHELAHLYLDHSNKAIRKHIETINSPQFKSEVKRLSKQEFRAGEEYEKLIKGLAFGSRRHRRENEVEADRQAFIFMKRTGFDCEGIRTCLQLLNTVDDSTLFRPLQVEHVFNFDSYAFRKKWTQKESAIFAEMTEDDSPLTKKEKDSLKTHPDCERRISQLNDSIGSAPAGSSFLVNEVLFKQLKDDFFLEMTEQEFRDKNLTRNLYYNLLLLQDGKHIEDAIFGIARCLNQVYNNQRDHKLGLMTDKESKIYSTDYNLLLRMVDRLKLEEVAAIAYYFCEKYASKMTGHAAFEEERYVAKIHFK